MPTSSEAVESCRAAEAKISQTQHLLAADARPETVEQCVTELGEVADLLRNLAAAGGDGLDAEATIFLRKIQRATQRLGRQIEHASNMCLGWMQLHLGSGYTAQGSPVLTPREAETLFEG